MRVMGKINKYSGAFYGKFITAARVVFGIVFEDGANTVVFVVDPFAGCEVDAGTLLGAALATVAGCV